MRLTARSPLLWLWYLVPAALFVVLLLVLLGPPALAAPLLRPLVIPGLPFAQWGGSALVYAAFLIGVVQLIKSTVPLVAQATWRILLVAFLLSELGAWLIWAQGLLTDSTYSGLQSPWSWLLFGAFAWAAATGLFKALQQLIDRSKVQTAAGPLGGEELMKLLPTILAAFREHGAALTTAATTQAQAAETMGAASGQLAAAASKLASVPAIPVPPSEAMLAAAAAAVAAATPTEAETAGASPETQPEMPAPAAEQPVAAPVESGAPASTPEADAPAVEPAVSELPPVVTTPVPEPVADRLLPLLTDPVVGSLPVRVAGVVIGHTLPDPQ